MPRRVRFGAWIDTELMDRARRVAAHRGVSLTNLVSAGLHHEILRTERELRRHDAPRVAQELAHVAREVLR